MKKFTSALLTVLAVFSFPTYAFADVAGIGTVIVFGVLPYLLIGAVLVIAAVILVRHLRRMRKASGRKSSRKDETE